MSDTHTRARAPTLAFPTHTHTRARACPDISMPNTRYLLGRDVVQAPSVWCVCWARPYDRSKKCLPLFCSVHNNGATIQEMANLDQLTRLTLESNRLDDPPSHIVAQGSHWESLHLHIVRGRGEVHEHGVVLLFTPTQ